jgi:hypothetical protein
VAEGGGGGGVWAGSWVTYSGKVAAAEGPTVESSLPLH